MKILFVLDDYEPFPSTNGLCVRNLIDEFRRQGDQVLCLTEKPVGSASFSELNGVKIFRVRHRFSERVTEHCRRKKTFLHYFVRKIVGLAKYKKFLCAYHWPFISNTCIQRMYAQIQEIYTAEKFDLIIGVYKPITAVYSVHLFKISHPEVKSVVYYLDAFAGGWDSLNLRKHKYCGLERNARSLEKVIDSEADLVISMEATEDYWRTFPLKEEKNNRIFLMPPMYIKTVENEIFSLSSAKLPYKNKIKTALYTGTLYIPGRDPRPLMKIFLKLCELTDIELVFVGAIRSSFLRKYIRLSKGKIKYLGYNDKEETTILQKKADFLVNIGNSHPNVVPSKIFEYAALGKPIISTYSFDNEPSIPFLKKYQHTFFIDERRIDDESMLRELANFVNRDHYIDMEKIDKIAYSASPSAFVNSVRRILDV